MQRLLTALFLALILGNFTGALPFVLAQSAETCDECAGEESQDECPPLCPDCACCGLVRFAFGDRIASLPRPVQAGAPSSDADRDPPEPRAREIMHVPRSHLG